jgi:hypothetical protein
MLSADGSFALCGSRRSADRAPFLDLPTNAITVVKYLPDRRRGKLLQEMYSRIGGYRWHRERKG